MLRWLFAFALFVSAFTCATAGPDGKDSLSKELLDDVRVFRPLPYLATGQFVPLHFALPDLSCYDRNPPRLTPAAKGAPILEAPLPPADTDESAAKPEFPPPAKDQQPLSAPADDKPDFTRIPDEVLDFFRDQNDSHRERHEGFFESIFDPAIPVARPVSKATYRQK